MSDFNKVVEMIAPLLKEHHFNVIDKYKDFVRCDSEHASVSVGYDEREHSYFILIGNKIDNSIPLDIENINEVFGYEVEKFVKMPFPEFFIDFFSTKGSLILTGDLNILEELKRNQIRRADKYTEKLLKWQNLNAADTAWLKNIYLDFIKYLDLIDKTTLPKSYEIKYSIAKNRLSN